MNKKMIKGKLYGALMLLLVSVMLLPMMSACNGDSTTPTQTDIGESGSGVTLNGVPLENYEIRYAWRDSNKERNGAKEIQTAIKKAFGIQLKVLEDTDETAEHVIMVGDRDGGTTTSSTESIGEYGYMLTRDEKSIYMLAKDNYGMQQAVKMLCDRIVLAMEDKEILIDKGSALSYEGRIVNTMTFNIRNWSATEAHLARISVTIKNANYPETIGFQEFGKPNSDWDWDAKLMSRPEIAERYASVGEDRGDHTGERATIYYRKDKYRLIESGTKWLYGTDPLGSDTPGRVSELPKEGNSLYYRVYTYVLLERISDGVRIAHINTHLDTASYYASTQIGCEVQTQQLSYAIAMGKKLHKENNCTVVFTGDYNCQPTTDPFKSITAHGFEWTEKIAVHRVGSQVDDYYNGESNPLKLCKDIDHIFLMDDKSYCLAYTICDKKVAYKGVEDYSSDHLARYATYVAD